MKTSIKLLLYVCLSACMFGQSAAISPSPKLQFLDNSGNELSGCQIFTYAAGSSTPIATYTDATATSVNTNPVICDSSGRASIWLLPDIGYKFVVETSAGVSLYTTDNIVVTLPNSGPFAQTGNNISNTNSGNVGIGCITPIAKLSVCGQSIGQNLIVNFIDSANNPGINLFGLGGAIFGSWEANSTNSLAVLAANGYAQLQVALSSVTVQDTTPSTGSTTLNLVDGGSQTGSLGDAHLLSVKNNSGTEIAFIDSLGEYAAPVFNGTGDSAGFTFQNYNSKFIVDTSGDITFSGVLSGAGGVIIDASANGTFNNITINGTCSGPGCPGGGGGGSPAGPTNAVQFNAGGSPPVLGGSGNLTWTGSAIVITGGIGNGAQFPVFSTTNTGHNNAFVTPDSTLYADGTGGFQALYASSGSSTTGFFIGSCTPSCTSAGYGLNGNGVLTVASCSGCGGSGSPGSPTNSIQFSGPVGTGGTFTGSANLVWNGSDVVVAGGASNGVQAPVFSTTNTGHNNAFVTSSSTLYADGTGGVQALYAASGSTTTGFFIGSCTPSCTSSGYGLNGNGVLNVASCTGCGPGGSGVPSITGTANQVLVNNTFGSPQSGAATLTLPQSIGTGSAVQFGSVVSNSYFLSNQTGSSLVFNSGGFIVDGNGNVNVESRVYTAGGLVEGTWPSGPFVTVIDASQNGTFHNLTVTGTCTGCGGGGSGVTSLNSLTGALNIVGTANEVIVTPSGTTITLATPQPLATTSTPSFTSMTLTSSLNANTMGLSGGLTVGGGTYSLTSAGALHASSLVVGSYGLTSGGALTVSSCSGCSGSSVVTGVQGSANVLVNGTTSGFQANNVTLTLPQNITTSSTPTFAGETINGISQVVGVNLDYASTGGSSGVLEMRGVTIINNATTFVGAGVSTTSGIGGGGFSYWNGSGYVGGQTHTFTNVTTATGVCTLTFQGGILTSFSGGGC